MSSSRNSLRRSRRAPKRSNSEYEVGDLVEVSSSWASVECALSCGPSRWVFRVDDMYAESLLTIAIAPSPLPVSLLRSIETIQFSVLVLHNC